MKINRKNIIKEVQKQHGVSYFIAEDIVDNMEYEIADYLDGNHFVDSMETLIKNYFDLPKNWQVEKVVKAILD